MQILNFVLLFVFVFSKDSLTEQNLKLRNENRALLQALKSLTESESAVSQGGQARLVSTSDGQPIVLEGDVVEGHLQINTEWGWAYVRDDKIGWGGAKYVCKDMKYDIPEYPFRQSWYVEPLNAPVTKYVDVTCQGAVYSLSNCNIELNESLNKRAAVKQKCTRLNYCPQNANFGTNTNEVYYRFELTGATGQEEVTVKTGNNEKYTLYLGKKPREQSSLCYLEIEFKNDGGNRDVFFKPLGAIISSYENDYIPVGASIKVEEHWEGWGCGDWAAKSGENERCKKVRAGKFLWWGTYQIKFNQENNNVWTGYGSG